MRALDPQTIERNYAQFKYDMGKEILDLLEDPKTIEIYSNPDGRVWVKQIGVKKRTLPDRIDPTRSQKLIASIATLSGQVITPDKPWLEAYLPTTKKERFQAEIPPFSPNGPSWNIRKKPEVVPSLQDYVTDEIGTQEQIDFLKWTIAKRHNFAVIGPTGSGKTILLNAAMNDPAAMAHRIGLVQDKPELRCDAPDHFELTPLPDKNAQQCIEHCLRKSMERIFFGEVRNGTMLYLLEAWNTGHEGGGTTLHANSLEEAPYRIEDLCNQAVLIPHRERINRTMQTLVMVREIPERPYRRITDIKVLAPPKRPTRDFDLRDFREAPIQKIDAN